MHYKCGHYDVEDIAWKAEVTCNLIGCKRCKHFNGTIYYEPNVKKSVGIWAREQTKLRGDNVCKQKEI